MSINKTQKQIEKEEFITKLNDPALPTDVHSFLLATPYTANPSYNFQGTVTQSFFFDNFFVKPDVGDQIYSDFAAEMAIKQAALIIGYKGCGKTTFVNWLLRNKRHSLVNFENYVADETTIIDNIITLIADAIDYDVMEKSRATLISFTKLFIEDRSNCTNLKNRLGKLYEIEKLFELIENYSELSRGITKYNYITIKEKLSDLFIEQLLSVFLLWDAAFRVAHAANSLNEQTYIFFDNLDVVDSSTELGNFMDSFARFFSNMMELTAPLSIDVNGKRVPLSELWVRYRFIFTLRETTYSKISDHLGDRAWDNRFRWDISTLYSRNQFIEQRKKFLDSETEISNANLRTCVNRLDELMRDRYFKENIMPLFNNDYRTIVRALLKAFKDWPEFPAAMALLQYGDSFSPDEREAVSYIRYGGRCALYRRLFDIFIDDGDFDVFAVKNIFTAERYAKPTEIYLGRMILTFLMLEADELRNDEYKQDKRAVPIYRLFNDLQGIAHSDDITTLLWSMFELKGKQYWSHLVTFDHIAQPSSRELSNISNNYNKAQITEDRHMPMVRITCAGRMALRDILIRFEYFAAISYAKSNERISSISDVSHNEPLDLPPLFLCGTKVITRSRNIAGGKPLSGERYLFNDVIESAFTELKVAYQREMSFNEYYVRSVSHNGNATNDFRLSTRREQRARKYLYEGSQSSVYYYEQIVFSAVGYIEMFRTYMLCEYNSNDNINIINKQLANAIIKFLQLIIPSPERNVGTGKNSRRLGKELNTLRALTVAGVLFKKAEQVSDMPSNRDIEIVVDED
jgi:hypothetical protein